MANTLAENMHRFGTKNLNSTAEQTLILKYIDTIDSSLRMQENAIIKQLQLYPSTQEKVKFLEFVEHNYMQTFFKSNQTVLREFKQSYVVKILNESAVNLSERISTYFNFVRNSILFEHNLFEFDIYSDRLNEQGVLDRIKSAGAAAVDAVKTGAKKIGKAATNIVKKGAEVVKGIWNKTMASDLAWFIPGINAIKFGQLVGYEVQKYWDKIKNMTLPQWIEEFRSFLNGAAGIAMQVILALSGTGNLINIIAYGALLAYDINLAATTGNWKGNLFNIITSGIGLIGTGAAAAALKPFQKILNGVADAKALIPTLKKSPGVWKSIGGLITKLANGGAAIVGKVANGLKWLITKIPGLKNIFEPLLQKLSPVKQLFDEFAHGLQAYSKGGATQNLTTHGYTGSAKQLAKGLGKKTAAVADKFATKKGVKAATAGFHIVKAAGETLANLVSKYKKPLEQLISLNPALGKNPNAPLPVNTKVQVA
jgi:LysM repeat protein